MRRKAMIFGGRARLAALAVVVVGLAAAGIAYASIPDSSGVIHGCYKNNGQLRVIDSEAGKTCKSSETALTWNQTGPSGVSGLSVVDYGTTPLTSGNYFTIVSCPNGKIAIGGSVLDTTNQANVKIEGGVNAGSRASSTPNGSWNVFFTVTSGGTDDVAIEQVCVNGPVGSAKQSPASSVVRVA